MKLKQALWLSIACLLYVGAGQAQAASITIFNTGVNGSGVSLGNGSTLETHYSLFSVPGGLSTILTRDSSGGFPVNFYTGTPDSSTSMWIGPNNNSQLVSPIGEYIYRTTFDLTGFDPATASLAGKWTTDNNGLDIRINGASLGYTTGFASFNDGFSPFTVTSGFISGLNTLDFVVNNGLVAIGNTIDNPAALRVEVSGTASVPEPASLFLLGSGFVALAAWRRRHAA